MTDEVDLGTYLLKDCSAFDEKGITRICDPRSWVLWLYAMWHGLAFRTGPYGAEVWEEVCTDWECPDRAYSHTVVKHPALGAVE